MNFIDLVNNEKERDCESKKKISFSQRSPIETKSCIGEKTLTSNGISMNINRDEVIESALFDRVKRDCSGKLLSTDNIRRFRKVGQDEWISMNAADANEFWNNEFEIADHSKAIEQGVKNIDSNKDIIVDESKNSNTVSGSQDSLESQDVKGKLKSNLKVMALVGVAVIAFGIIKIKG